MKVNGEDILLDQPCSLADFLQQHGYHLNRVAVELCGKIVPKAQYTETLLQNDDRLEIVGFVGGG